MGSIVLGLCSGGSAYCRQEMLPLPASNLEHWCRRHSSGGRTSTPPIPASLQSSELKNYLILGRRRSCCCHSQKPPAFSSGLSGVAQPPLTWAAARLLSLQCSIQAAFGPVLLQDGSEVSVFRPLISEKIQLLWSWTDGSESQQVGRELCLIPTSWTGALTAEEGQGNCCFLWPRCVVKMLPFLTRAKGQAGQSSTCWTADEEEPKPPEDVGVSSLMLPGAGWSSLPCSELFCVHHALKLWALSCMLHGEPTCWNHNNCFCCRIHRLE